MKKKERIARYGKAAYERYLEQTSVWAKEHREKVKAHNNEQNRKGSKRYGKKLEELRTGIQGERHKIRVKHAKQYKPFKDIIAPESQIHHEWLSKTDEYRGVALVEKEAHQYGIVDVIEILDGKITLLTEEEVKAGGKDFEN